METKTDYHFSYFSEALSDSKISVIEKQVSFTTILESVLHNNHLDYLFHGQLIVVFKTQNIDVNKWVHGRVVDANTNLPVSYATVEIKNKQQGIISNGKGEFSLEIKYPEKNDTVLISFLGYEVKKFPLHHFQNNTDYTIYLKPIFYNIEAVNIVAKNYKIISIGNTFNISTGSIYLDTHGQQTALFIENKQNRKGILSSIEFYLSKKGNTSAPLRIRIYDIDSITDNPGYELLNRMVVVKPNIDKGWLKLNMEEFHINFPENGLFIALEGIFPDDVDTYFTHYQNKDPEIKDKKQRPSDHLIYGQRIGYNGMGKNNTWHYSINGEWFQLEKNRFNIMIKANILITNDDIITK